MPKYRFIRLILVIAKMSTNQDEGSVADLNVKIKVRVGTTEFKKSYLKTFFYAFKFLTINLKIKPQIRKAKRIYSYLHSESDAKSKL